MTPTESDVYALVLGRVIATLREKRGWKQKDLADHLGIAQSSLSRIEHGQAQPEAFLFKKMADTFGMTVGELAGTVDVAVERTQQCAAGACVAGQGDQGAPWWAVALGIAGVVGLAGLVAFAVAAVLDDEDHA